MNKKRVLFLYSRNIEINDSGGARTTILLVKYLANHGYKCFTLFRIENFSHENVRFVCGNSSNPNDIEMAIEKYKISAIVIPEGVVLTKVARKAVINKDVKIISALHSKPGYERLRLHVLLKESMYYNERISKRIRAFLLLCAYPLFYSIYKWTYYFKFRNVYKFCDYLILLSKEFIPEFCNLYNVSPKKLLAIGNPISFDEFATCEDIKRKKKNILIVARFDERAKRLLVALQIWQSVMDRYPDWTLQIVGFGRSLPVYEHYIKKHKLKNVILLGKHAPKEYYRKASIFMMTSAFEGWGMTVVEAMQMGCVPIVMDSFSSIHSIIDDGVNGVITRDNDIVEYVAKLCSLIDCIDNRYKMAFNAIEKSHTWEPDNTSNEYKKLLDKIFQ